MGLNVALPSTVELDIDGHLVRIYAFNAREPKQILRNQAVNIIASGPSVASLAFTEQQLNSPTIFVNGSISLTDQYDFTDVVGYVISDARFINHQPEILQKYYTGQPLYATLAVFETIAASLPDLILTYHQAMRVLYPVDRPWGVKSNKLLFNKLNFRQKLLNRKKPLAYFAMNPSFVIDTSHKPQPIGISLDVTHGFVEAGTVVYVAAQLAFSRQASAIHLYGVDLLNSDQPRFYENEDNSAPSKLDKAISDRIVPSFNLLARVYREQGIPVINHSPISKALFDGLDG